jgi:tRNA (cytidine/uridine-2'-O-)-methyltransferase
MDSSTLRTPENLPPVGFCGPTIALHRPVIPQNTGNISRLCVAVQSPLIITGRAGFDFDAAAVRRAGLDHWSHLDFTHFPKFKDFYLQNQNRRIIAVTKVAESSALEFNFTEGDILLFGNETMGLPPALLARLAHRVYLPMSGPVRSLNLSNSVAVVAYAYIRNVVAAAATHGMETYPRTYYNGKIKR